MKKQSLLLVALLSVVMTNASAGSANEKHKQAAEAVENSHARMAQVESELKDIDADLAELQQKLNAAAGNHENAAEIHHLNGSLRQATLKQKAKCDEYGKCIEHHGKVVHDAGKHHVVASTKTADGKVTHAVHKPLRKSKTALDPKAPEAAKAKAATVAHKMK